MYPTMKSVVEDGVVVVTVAETDDRGGQDGGLTGVVVLTKVEPHGGSGGGGGLMGCCDGLIRAVGFRRISSG
ncbi:hypothetical protein L6452_05085 [Arctium lappa]|uniref:Uncharacterized protein n=1 Tax=Arctium lappa TaxID=4217 RepID=A0ACB9EFE5_ARCLA|nr:hypothetical protein L6452_05085 [Arctium lappa]